MINVFYMDDADKQVKEIETLYNNKKFAEITTILTDDLLENYNNAELYAWCSRAYNKLNKYNQSLQYAQKSIDIDSNCFLGYFAMANTWYKKQEYDKAMPYYKKAIELKNDYIEAYKRFY